MSNGLDERIKQRAYDIWLSEGRPEGKHEEHWHRAAAEIRGETAVGGEAPMPGKTRGRAKAAAAGEAPAKAPRGRKAEAEPASAGTEPKARRSRTAGKPRSTALG